MKVYPKKHILKLFCAVSVLLALLLHFYYVFKIYFVGSDDGIFLTIASGILNGQIPYKDFIENKPPGIHYLLALFFAVFGKFLIVGKILLLLFNFGTALVVYLIGRKIIGEEAGLVSSILYLFGLLLYDATLIYTEPFAAFFTSIAVLLFIIYTEKKKRILLFSSGIAIGISATFKQPGILILFSFILYYIYALFTGNRNKDLIQKILYEVAVIVAGVLIPIVYTVVYFWSAGSLSELIFYVITVQATGGYPSLGIEEFLNNSVNNFILIPIIWILSFSFSVLILSRRDSKTSLLKIIVFWFIISLIPTFIRQYPHYYIPALPAASILTVYGTRELYRVRRIGIVLLFLILLLIPLYKAINEDISSGIKNKEMEKELIVSSYIESHTRPEEKILIVGCTPAFYFLSEREPAMKVLCFADPSKFDTGFTPEDIIREIEKKKVKYILVIDPADHPYYKDVFDFINSEYELKRNFNLGLSFNQVKVYRLKNSSETTKPSVKYVISNFEKDENWTAGELNSVFVKEGKFSLKLTSINGSAVHTFSNIILNLKDYSDTDSINIWAYIDNASNLEIITFHFCNDYDCRDRRFSYITSESEFKDGWNIFPSSKMNYVFNGNGTFSKIIRKIGISIKARDGKNVTVFFDNWHISG